MRTGMCCCSASAQREKTLSCYHAQGKRSEQERHVERKQVRRGLREKQGREIVLGPITAKSKPEGSEISL